VPAQALIERLESVKVLGNDRWLARCPAHKDGRPSLSVRDVGDGRTLVHCFAGCTADEVLSAAGLEWSALFAESPKAWPGRWQNMSEPKYERETLEHFRQELLVATIILGDVLAGRPADVQRLGKCKATIVKVLAEIGLSKPEHKFDAAKKRETAAK
jgi:hypothetical protein